jgi:putative phosphoribosyl transferase
LPEAASQTLTIAAGPLALPAELREPEAPRGLVIFAHGSGSSRLSPRNRQVADALKDAGFASLLMDLLTDQEAALRAKVFDIDLLADRLICAIDWAGSQPGLAALPIALFGASTGAAAALEAASQRPRRVAAVISRGGRPDLALDVLGQVTAPTLLIVGGRDEEVLQLNRVALERLAGFASLRIVPGATHLFEEPGALEEVARLAVAWCDRHLPSLRTKPSGGETTHTFA